MFWSTETKYMPARLLQFTAPYLDRIISEQAGRGLVTKRCRIPRSAALFHGHSTLFACNGPQHTTAAMRGAKHSGAMYRLTLARLFRRGRSTHIKLLTYTEDNIDLRTHTLVRQIREDRVDLSCNMTAAHANYIPFQHLAQIQIDLALLHIPSPCAYLIYLFSRRRLHNPCREILNIY